MLFFLQSYSIVGKSSPTFTTNSYENVFIWRIKLLRRKRVLIITIRISTHRLGRSICLMIWIKKQFSVFPFKKFIQLAITWTKEICTKSASYTYCFCSKRAFWHNLGCESNLLCLLRIKISVHRSVNRLRNNCPGLVKT